MQHGEEMSKHHETDLPCDVHKYISLTSCVPQRQLCNVAGSSESTLRAWAASGIACVLSSQALCFCLFSAYGEEFLQQLFKGLCFPDTCLTVQTLQWRRNDCFTLTSLPIVLCCLPPSCLSVITQK